MSKRITIGVVTAARIAHTLARYAQELEDSEYDPKKNRPPRRIEREARNYRRWAAMLDPENFPLA